LYDIIRYDVLQLIVRKIAKGVSTAPDVCGNVLRIISDAIYLIMLG